MKPQRFDPALFQPSNLPQFNALHPPFMQRKLLCLYSARIAHRWIRLNHGHTKLCFCDMALRLGLKLRSLERTFASAYGISMREFSTEQRIKHIHEIRKTSPGTKVAVLALQLGYKSDKAFMRFAAVHNIKTSQQSTHRNEQGTALRWSA